VHFVSEQNALVLVEHPRPHVALVTLNRPDRMNSMAFDVMVPLKKVLDELNFDNDTRVVVDSRLARITSRQARCRTSTD